MISFDIPKEEFLRNYFDQKPFFQQNSVTQTGINWSELNSLIYAWDLAAGGFIVHQNGVLPPSEYSETYQDIEVLNSRLSPDKLERLLVQGATLVLNRIDKRNSIIGEICATLAKITEEKTVANAYIAFGGAGTFGKHWDTHDVFAVQLLGKKLWRVYEPTFQWPLPHQRSRDYKSDCPYSPIFEKVLQPGDVLYLPRGWWHEALPLSGTPTFHIAAGIHTAKTIDYVQWGLQEVMPQFIETRKSLLITSPDEERIRDFLHCTMLKLMDPGLIERFISQMRTMGNEYRSVDLNRLL